MEERKNSKRNSQRTSQPLSFVIIKNIRESKIFKRLVNIVHFLVDISTVAALIFAILAFQNVGNIKEIKDHIKSKPNSHAAIAEWIKELDCIRIGYSRDYIENIIGKPQMINTIEIDSAEYIETTYSNSYFTLFCVYEEDSSLLGILIIGNDKNFKLYNYRCEFKLFDYTVNETEKYCFENGLASIIFFRNNHSNRLSANSYYFECNYQHSIGAVEPYIIGYGISDIGYLYSYDKFYSSAISMHIANGNYEDRVELYEASKNDAIRNLPINSFLIMRDSDVSIKLLDKCLIPYAYLGMSRSAYANMQNDYSDWINSFNKRFENIKE